MTPKRKACPAPSPARARRELGEQVRRCRPRKSSVFCKRRRTVTKTVMEICQPPMTRVKNEDGVVSTDIGIAEADAEAAGDVSDSDAASRRPRQSGLAAGGVRNTKPESALLRARTGREWAQEPPNPRVQAASANVMRKRSGLKGAASKSPLLPKPSTHSCQMLS